MVPILIGITILIFSSVLSHNLKATNVKNDIFKTDSEYDELNPPSGDLNYPNASVISQSSGTTILESFDDPDKITNWYKNKLSSMSVKSFVTTKTSGEVLNKLLGATGKKEIKVEITKKNDHQKVMIMVSF